MFTYFPLKNILKSSLRKKKSKKVKEKNDTNNIGMKVSIFFFFVIFF